MRSADFVLKQEGVIRGSIKRRPCWDLLHQSEWRICWCWYPRTSMACICRYTQVRFAVPGTQVSVEKERMPTRKREPLRQPTSSTPIEPTPGCFRQHLKTHHDLATRTVEESEGTSRASLPATWRSFAASEVRTHRPVRFRPKPYLGYNRPGACCGRLGEAQAKRGAFPPKPRGAARGCGDGTCPPRGGAGKVATQHHRAATLSVQQWPHMAT